MRKLTDGTNVDAPTTDYPKGRVRDKAGAIPGTIGNEVLLGDIVQYFQKMIADTNVTENDQPDNETNGYQLLESLQEFIKNPGLVGHDLAILQKVGVDTSIIATFTAMAAINDTDIAFIASSDNLLKTYRFDGFDWAQIGNTLSPGASFANVVMTKLDTNKIAYIDSINGQLRTYSWDGTDWTQDGNGLALSIGSGKSAVTKIDTNTVAVCLEFSNVLRTYSWDGTDWSLVGNSLALTNDDPSLTTLEKDVVAFWDSNNDELRTYSFDGTNWSLTGSGYTLASSAGCSILALDKNNILFILTTSNQGRLYKWDGSNWTPTGGIYYEVRSGGAPASGYPITKLTNNMIVLYNSSDDILINLIRIIGY